MEYNRKAIESLEKRQFIYIKTEERDRPKKEEINAALNGYEDREAFLIRDLRGWALVFRTEASEQTMPENVWKILEKIN